MNPILSQEFAEYLEYALGLLRNVPADAHKKMMDEYLLYSEGVLFKR